MTLQEQNGKRERRPRRGPRPRKSAGQNPTELVQSMLRYPGYLGDLIYEAARESGRSMNSEIIWRLELSFWLDDMLKARLISCRVPAEARGGVENG